MKFFLCWMVVLAVVSQSLSMRGALFRSGRSIPLVRGMQNAREFVTQDFLRFGRAAGFSPLFLNDEREDFLPPSQGSQLFRNPLDYGFIV